MEVNYTEKKNNNTALKAGNFSASKAITTTVLVSGLMFASSASGSVSAAAVSTVRAVDAGAGKSSAGRLSIKPTYNESEAERERVAMSRMSDKGATYSRLADLFEARGEIAAELETPVVQFGVFQHVESILDSLESGLVDQIRIGVSPRGGLELRARHDGSLFIAAVDPAEVTLRSHSGRRSQIVSAGDLSDESVARFLERKS